MNIMPWRKRQEVLPARSEEEFGALESFRSEMNRLMERFFGEPMFGLGFGRSEFPWNPTVDVDETEDEVLISAEVPGVEPKNLDVSVSGRLLTIIGEKSESSERKAGGAFFSERRFGSFKRTIELPTEVTEEVSAEHKNGVLNIRLRKAHTSPSRKIPISAH